MSNTTPKVSIICRCYNQELTISLAIQSVLNQTFKNWELIIIDDCSSDNTVNCIKKFVDKRIKLYINDYNLGPIGALNKGLELCSGEYISILDGDDSYFPHKLEKQVKFLDENSEYGAVFSFVEILSDKTTSERVIKFFKKVINSQHGTREEMLLKLFERDNYLAFPTEMFRKKYSMVFPESLIATGDYNFHINMLINTNIKILEEPLVYYNMCNADKHVANWISKSVIDIELLHLHKKFLAINDLELFQKTFKTKYEKYLNNNEPEIKMIPYLMARMLIETKNKNFIGRYLLSALFNDNNYFNYIRQSTNLTFKEYVDLRKFRYEKDKCKIKRFFNKLFKIVS